MSFFHISMFLVFLLVLGLDFAFDAFSFGFSVLKFYVFFMFLSCSRFSSYYRFDGSLRVFAFFLRSLFFVLLAISGSSLALNSFHVLIAFWFLVVFWVLNVFLYSSYLLFFSHFQLLLNSSCAAGVKRQSMKVADGVPGDRVPLGEGREKGIECGAQRAWTGCSIRDWIISFPQSLATSQTWRICLRGN